MSDRASPGGWWGLCLHSECQTGAVVTEAWEKNEDWGRSGCLLSLFSLLSASGISWWNPQLRDSKGVVCHGFQRSENAALQGICSLWFPGPGNWRLQIPRRAALQQAAQCLEQKVVSSGYRLLTTGQRGQSLCSVIWVISFGHCKELACPLSCSPTPGAHAKSSSKNLLSAWLAEAWPAAGQ